MAPARIPRLLENAMRILFALAALSLFAATPASAAPSAPETIPRELLHDFLLSEIAAQRGDLSAPVLYARARLALHNPRSGKDSIALALRSLESASADGYDPARVLYGSILASGSLGVPKDLPRAVALFEASSRDGSSAADFLLGLILTEPSLGYSDEPRGDALLLRAWLAGVEDAKGALLSRYLAGRPSAIAAIEKAQADGSVFLRSAEPSAEPPASPEAP